MQTGMKSYARACTGEISVHLVVFLLVIFTITGLFFPALTIYWIVYAVIGISAAAGFVSQNLPASFLESWILFVPATTVLLLGCHIVIVYRRLFNFHKNNPESHKRKLIELPDNEKSSSLKNLVNEIWVQCAGYDKDLPHIVWFVNFNVLARAVERRRLRQIQVSSGLWERAVKNDPLVRMILMHETAHLVYRDIPLFYFLESVAITVKQVIRFVFWIGAGVTVLAAIYKLISDINQHSGLSTLFSHLFGAFFVAGLLIAPLLLGEMIIRRNAGFITSLLELRADVTAAEWIGNLHHFSSTLDHDKTVHLSTFSELGRSLVSLNLTHISESERISILASPNRLSSPKLRYFVLSVLLAVLVPVNSFTPMLWAGALDHSIMTVVIVTIHLAAFMMLVRSPLREGLSPRRSLTLALTLFLVLGLASTNTYAEGYFLTAVSASLFSPNGFAQHPMTWMEFGNALSLTIGDRIEQLQKSYFHWAILPELLIAALCIYLSSRLMARSSPNKWMVLAGMLVMGYITIICCYDPYRDYWYDNLLLSPGSVVSDLTADHPGLRYLVPVLALLVYAGLCRTLKPVR